MQEEDKYICLDDSRIDDPNNVFQNWIKKDELYTIREVHRTPMEHIAYVLNEVHNEPIDMYGAKIEPSFNAKRFVRLDHYLMSL